MKTLKIFGIFLIILLSLQCSDNEITNIEFSSSDHPVSKISKEATLMIAVIPDKKLYGFSDNPSILNYEGNGSFEFLVKKEEMNNLIAKLSDTNYFHWEFMTAVTPYPEEDCNLLMHGKDPEDNFLDYMCTIGRGEETYQILIELSNSFSGEARSALIYLANYYKNK